MTDDDLEGGPDSDIPPIHPDTDRVVLPSPVGSASPPFHIPSPPGVPKLGPDERTLPPGHPDLWEDPRVQDPMADAPIWARHLNTRHNDLVERLDALVLEWNDWTGKGKTGTSLRDHLLEGLTQWAAPRIDVFIKRDDMRERAIATIEEDMKIIRGKLAELEQRVRVLEPDGK